MKQSILSLSMLVAVALSLVVAAGAMAQDQVDDTMIKVASSAVCQAVVDRAPVGSGDVFASQTPKVFCFTHVTGASGDTQITHNWYYKGTLKASVVLPVRSPNWRTWSSKAMDPAWTGEWMVEILTADGKPLDSIIFYIQ